mmetsp:Transcript_18579/g.74660  ORF Transcript_18579/g.74660 Transcript_18579/m.74660 type:complete len:93 (+) Transcript_18579:412-690(+)
MSPVAGENMEQVSFIGSCGDLRFYLKPSDHCIRIAPNTYLFMVAEDCLGLELKNPKEDVSEQPPRSQDCNQGKLLPAHYGICHRRLTDYLEF